MTISAQTVKELRERTGVGMMECKQALSESGGDMEEAIKLLRKKGLSAAAKKAGRATSQGLVGSYIHPGGKIGVLIEVNCETDFVAQTDEFQGLVRNLAMQVAASEPRFVSREEVTPEILEGEREIYRAHARASGKPEAVLEKIVDGKMTKFYEENCLLEQPYVRETSLTIAQYISTIIARLGENITVRRFARFRLGEAPDARRSSGEAEGGEPSR